jgi:hypothetical protein
VSKGSFKGENRQFFKYEEERSGKGPWIEERTSVFIQGPVFQYSFLSF